MTFDEAGDRFEANKNSVTAADYLETALQYSNDGMIGDDTFHDVLIRVRDYLRGLTLGLVKSKN